MIAEAFSDAALLRQTIALRINTATQAPAQVADTIRNWVRAMQDE